MYHFFSVDMYKYMVSITPSYLSNVFHLTFYHFLGDQIICERKKCSVFKY